MSLAASMYFVNEDSDVRALPVFMEHPTSSTVGGELLRGVERRDACGWRRLNVLSALFRRSNTDGPGFAGASMSCCLQRCGDRSKQARSLMGNSLRAFLLGRLRLRGRAARKLCPKFRLFGEKLWVLRRELLEIYVTDMFCGRVTKPATSADHGTECPR